MTEYDYSPEAYERYLSTQRRISSWVDLTETCRPQFANALSPPSDYTSSHDADSRTNRPGRRFQRRHSQHFRSRSPSVDSSSSEEYSYGPTHLSPAPMRSAPGRLGGFLPAQMPWNQPPMAPPQSRPIPPSYYGLPSSRNLQSHRRIHSYGPRPLHPMQSVRYSPPVSPGVYGYPAPPIHVVLPQQHGRPMPYVYLAPPW